MKVRENDKHLVFVCNFLKACYLSVTLSSCFTYHVCPWCLLAILKGTKGGLSLINHGKRPKRLKDEQEILFMIYGWAGDTWSKRSPRRNSPYVLWMSASAARWFPTIHSIKCYSLGKREFVSKKIVIFLIEIDILLSLYYE